MSELTSGRATPCKNNVGGTKAIYLMDFSYYPVALLGGFKTFTLTSFPTTFIIKYEARQINVSESYSEGSYDQEITFNLPKIDVDTHVKANLLNNKTVRAIAEGYNGDFKIYGLQNGLDAEVGANTGSGKTDFNGYNVVLKGIEEYKSHFINDLSSVGFFEEGLSIGGLLASSSQPSSLSNKISDTNIVQ